LTSLGPLDRLTKESAHMNENPAYLLPAVERLLDCPKLMTNGPCGGVALDGTCEVDQRICVWAETVTARPRARNTPAPPGDWSNPQPFSTLFGEQARSLNVDDTLDKDRRPLRQGGRFESMLRAGRFVVTAEINPPDSSDPAALLARVQPLAGVLDAVHISDNSLASPHMCGLAMAALIERVGVETILHMTCRDRNRNMLQADLLGAAALGIKNVLCLTGDHPAIGDHPGAKAVFDLDAISWIDTARHLRDEATLLSGRTLDVAPNVLIGGGAEPTAAPLEFRPHRLAAKIAAGIDFAVTQVVYDMKMFADFMAKVRDLGLDQKIHILVSVGALAGPAMARGMNNTPGVVVPEHVIKRLDGAAPGKRREEGLRICIEQIEQLKEMPGISGIDIMDLDPARYIEVVEAANLTHRPFAAR
jgi:methylenetetrahydrofolate reductase (NADPH)